MTSVVQPIEWNGRSLRLLDQRALPDREDYVRCNSAEAVAAAIRNMTVRGAPAIGIAAAYGVAMSVVNDGPAGFDGVTALLAASRPTAVNLRWALARMRDVWYAAQTSAALVTEAERIHHEDLTQNLAMGELGAGLIGRGARVLTHCNTGALATGGHGTALGVIRTAYAHGQLEGIFHTETRPWMQGARLTAWELKKDGIPARMIADGAAAHLMNRERINWVIVGADRIAANGDTANKIGTYGLAVAAARHGVRFMVVAPSGTFDLACPDGDHIPIEERGAAELTELGGRRIAPSGVEVFNPVFDVTPAELIDAIVCERGVIEKPDTAKLRALLA